MAGNGNPRCRDADGQRELKQGCSPLMFATLAVVLPIFIVIALGLGAARSGLLSERAADGISEFVFVIAIPALLFRSLATAPLPEAQPWFYWLAYFLALAAVWAVASFIARTSFGITGRALPIAGFTSAQSNTVFVGIPLILQAYGDAAAVPIFLLLAIHLPVTLAVASLMIEKASMSGAVWLGIARKLALHPILLAIFCGILYRLTGLPLPDALSNAAKLLGDAAGPAALFALGMTLSRYGLSAPPMLLALMAVLKLIVQPMIVYILAFHILPVPPLWAAVAVLFAACPTGVNAYLLADRYQTGVALTSATIAITTMLAALTMTGWLWLITGAR
jgi:malonate transporter and related proteins